MLSIKLEQSANNNSAVIEKKPAELKNKSPKYKVLLHNDPVNSMEYVTISLREVVPQLSEQDAIAIMLEACLLYTSPSPRDRLLSRMPSSA